MTSHRKHIIIYTDGACSGNPGPGGWGVVLKYKETSKELYGSEKHTTNNRMELKAAIEGLRALKEPCNITLYTDSNYVKDGITKWIHQWKNAGWRTSQKKPVKNVELWQELDEAMQMHHVTWQWVAGHSGDPGNDQADMLAVRGRDEARINNAPGIS